MYSNSTYVLSYNLYFLPGQFMIIARPEINEPTFLKRIDASCHQCLDGLLIKAQDMHDTAIVSSCVWILHS